MFHLAGVLDDGLVEGQTAARIAAVLAPKVEGARHLDALTEGLDLSHFVLFSSAVGTLGGPGQASYAAANAWLDALAVDRRRRGLSGQSLAWGLWTPQGQGMTAHLGPAELARARRAGMEGLTPEAGLALLDVALGRPDAVLVPARLRLERVEAAEVPALLAGLVRGRRAKVVSAAPVTGVGDAAGVLRAEAAGVLGLVGPEALADERALQELGLDSLMAVELRNRVRYRLGVELTIAEIFRAPLAELVTRVRALGGASVGRVRGGIRR